MSTRSYIGTVDTNDPRSVRVRYVHCDGYPSARVPVLQALWAGVADRDTERLITLLLEHDWDYLDPTITMDKQPLFTGGRPIPGIGMALTVTDTAGTTLPPNPVTSLPLSRIGELDAEWIYLLNPSDDTIAIHQYRSEALAAAALDPNAEHRKSASPAPTGNHDRRRE